MSHYDTEELDIIKRRLSPEQLRGYYRGTLIASSLEDEPDTHKMAAYARLLQEHTQAMDTQFMDLTFAEPPEANGFTKIENEALADNGLEGYERTETDAETWRRRELERAQHNAQIDPRVWGRSKATIPRVWGGTSDTPSPEDQEAMDKVNPPIGDSDKVAYSDEQAIEESRRLQGTATKEANTLEARQQRQEDVREMQSKIRLPESGGNRQDSPEKLYSQSSPTDAELAEEMLAAFPPPTPIADMEYTNDHPSDLTIDLGPLDERNPE